MDSNYYQIYTNSVIQLAASMVIKSTDTANMINTQLRITNGDSAVDLQDPTSWKYYLNLVGEYHPLDTPMQVVSVDTLQTIDFTRENLQFHRGTAKAYEYGSTYYKELVNRFPNQVQLILGILYPATDIQTCIDAQDGTILSYPPFLVEEYEYSLIPTVQEWIYSYFTRWYNSAYTITDELYSTAVLAVLYQNLVPCIMTARLAKTKTNEAHSYHVRQYLASHGMLDSFITYLTRAQALWLYRNIAYITRNAGKKETFDWLLENIMTKRGLPLASFEMRHNLENQPANLKPELQFQKLPLNTAYNYDQINEFTLEQVFNKEEPLARDNYKYREVEESKALQSMQYATSNRLNTKLLESTIIDYSGSEHYTLVDTLLYHWIWLSHTNHYRAYVQVTSPVTNETISLTAKEAFEFFVYASCATIGIVFDKLPAVIATRVIRTPRPTVADLMTAADERVVSSSFAMQMLAKLPVPQPMISVDSFYNYCVELHKAALSQYYTVVQESGLDAYGQKFGIMSRCWADVGIQTGDADANQNGNIQFYADWFTRRNIQISDYKLSDLATIANDLLSSATGTDSSTAITLKDIQQAMVRLMAQLSSYSVQYVANINDGPVIDANTGGIRYDDVAGYLKGRVLLQVEPHVTNPKASLRKGLDYDTGEDMRLNTSTSISVTTDASIISIDVSASPESFQQRFNHNTVIGIRYDYGDMPPNPRNITPVIGIENFLLLPLEDQLKVPDFW